jgi:hypothetical protein
LTEAMSEDRKTRGSMGAGTIVQHPAGGKPAPALPPPRHESPTNVDSRAKTSAPKEHRQEGGSESKGEGGLHSVSHNTHNEVCAVVAGVPLCIGSHAGDASPPRCSEGDRPHGVAEAEREARRKAITGGCSPDPATMDPPTLSPLYQCETCTGADSEDEATAAHCRGDRSRA